MCAGIALAWNELPPPLVERHRLRRRVRGDSREGEAHFLYRAEPALLPVWHEGQLKIVRWGNRRRPGGSRSLPPTGWTWRSTVEAGGWLPWQPEPVDIPASYGLENGVWFLIRQGIRGLLVRDEHGEPVVYMICEPASPYYQVMTRSPRMPSMIEERI